MCIKPDKKTIAIIVLSVVSIIAISFSIYYGCTGTVDYANQLRDKLDKLQREHDEQGASLESVSKDLASAVSDAGQLRDRIGRAYDIAQQSDDRFTQFENEMAKSGNDIDAIIARQQRIAELIERERADNSRLREALSLSESGGTGRP